MSIEGKLDEVLAFVADVKRPDPDAPAGFWGWLTQARAWKQRALKAESRIEILEVQLDQMGEVNEHLRSWLMASTATAAHITNQIAPPDPREKFRKQA